jgi:hypothetical protein
MPRASARAPARQPRSRHRGHPSHRPERRSHVRPPPVAAPPSVVARRGIHRFALPPTRAIVSSRSITRAITPRRSSRVGAARRHELRRRSHPRGTRTPRRPPAHEGAGSNSSSHRISAHTSRRPPPASRRSGHSRCRPRSHSRTSSKNTRDTALSSAVSRATGIRSSHGSESTHWVWHRWQHAIALPRRRLAHASPAAARAHPAVLARERHQPIVTAARTPSAHEAAGQHPAAEEGLELRDDVPRQRATALLHLLGEGREVIAHEAVHHPVADGVAGANVGMSTAVGHRCAP